MRRITPRLVTAAICFALGVSASAIYRVYSLPEVSTLAEPVSASLPVGPSCFPGLSITIPEKRSQALLEGVPRSDDEYCNQLEIDWYSNTLKIMNEGSLCTRSSQEESYRFLWLRSFDNPIAIRVQRVGLHRLVVVKELDLSPEHGLAGSLKTFSFPLSEEEWNLFMRKLELACFWQMPTPNELMMCDGAEWIMEGRREGRFHVVDRQSPDEGAYRDACLYLLRVSQVLKTIPQVRIY